MANIDRETAALEEVFASEESEPSNEELTKRAHEKLHRLLPADPELRASVPSRAKIDEILKCTTTIECVAKAFELYADRSCFAERALEVDAGAGVRSLDRYENIRFADVWARVEAFASGLRHEKLADTGDFVGICGFGSVDWVVADLACIYLAAVSAPIQTGMSPTDMKQIIQETQLRCIVCSAEQLDAIDAVLPECPSVENLIHGCWTTWRCSA